MKLLKIKKSEKSVVADPHPAITEVAEFKDLLEEKDKPRRYLAYIYHMENIESPYTEYGDEKREKEVKYDLFGDENKQMDEIVEKCREKYRELTKTAEEELLESAINNIYSYIKYFNNVDPLETDDNGKLKWKMKDVTRVMEKLPSIVKSLEDLREQVAKGEDTAGEVRGGVEITEFNK